MKNNFTLKYLRKVYKVHQTKFKICLGFGFCLSNLNAQMVVNGAAAKIVSVGASSIVLNDISYQNEASSAHLLGSELTMKFTGTGVSSMTISSSTGLSTTPANLTMDRAGGVLLQSPLEISNTLSLINGKLDLTTFDLNMFSSAIVGGSAASYVKTSSTGVLGRNVGSVATNFPLGNVAYNPAILTNTGTSDNFTMRVVDNVTANGTGVGATTAEAVVKRTWMIDEATAGGSNATIRLYWNGAGEEINTFAASSAFMAHYISAASMWDNIGGTLGAGYVETTGNSSFSPFTISSSPLFAPLPVELMSFDAQCTNEDVVVAWKTASEHNTLNFIVERSDDGTQWNEIQTVTAAVNSNSVLSYTIQDAGAARGIHYYRLMQTDQDGAQKLYGPIMTNCGSNELSFMTFPNPSDNEFTIFVEGIELIGETTLNMRDANGKLVRSIALELQPGVNSFLVPDVELAPGMYYLQLENDDYRSPSLKQSIR